MAKRCLVTGATGYVGGRLVPELLAAGWDVRVLARHPERLADRPWVADVEVVAGDAADQHAMRRAMANVEVAYYLMHALGTGSNLVDAERQVARSFAAAAEEADVNRIVFLGGLTSDTNDGQVSEHMAARTAVADVLLESSVPTTVLQAAIVIGSGSLSFEMLRYLTERLPAMVTPRWVRTLCQPIAIRDVLRYLVGSASMPAEVNRRFDIGGPDVLSYQEMMQRYAKAAGLRHRVILPVNVLTPRLSSRWVGLVTPVPSAVARPLVDSLRVPAVCGEHDIARYLPDPPEGLIGFDRAVTLALTRIQDADVTTRWSQASVPGAPSDPLPTDPDWAGGSLYTDERSCSVAAAPQDLWWVIEGVGGDHGWYSFPLAWEVRGLADRALGGVGLRRGRRDPMRLFVGETVDFWRVEERQPDQLLRLRAEMKNPGLAWLEMWVEVDAENRTRYRQRAIFAPRGLAGQVYWWAVSPFHTIVFGTMVKNIARAAEQRAADQAHPPANV